jgi:SAM-dependent methyltransferase
MRIGAIPENLIEFLLTMTGGVPTPLLDTLQAILRARAIMVATKLGLFEALKEKPLTTGEVVAKIGTDARATEKLLNSLVGARYLRFVGQRYQLVRLVRKWLLKDSPQSLHDNMLHRFLEWDAVEHIEEFVRSGKPLNIHQSMTAEQWPIYQHGMRSLAGLSASEVASRVPVPPGARRMLDLGGSHGYYSVALCRRHPELCSTILDLPAAVEFAAPILARENMGDRIGFRTDDVLTADLGDGQWDFIFASQLLHHFDEETNLQLLRRVALALRPGGIIAILEILRPSSPQSAGQTGALLDLFFAITSPSGTWSLGELAEWQRLAGLIPQKKVSLLSIPGGAIQSAVKPAT